MIALYIIGGILLLLCLLMLLRIRVFFSYYGGIPRLDIRAGIIKFGMDLKGTHKEEEPLPEPPKKKKEKKKKKKEKKPGPKITDALRVFRAGVYKFLRKYKKYARLEKYIVKISLATDDPAKTALLYGGLSGVVCSLHAFALSVKNKSRRVGDIYTEYRPDFYAEKTDAAVEIGFSLKVWQILSCAMELLHSYRKYKKLPPKAEKKKKGDKDDKSGTA